MEERVGVRVVGMDWKSWMDVCVGIVRELRLVEVMGEDNEGNVEGIGWEVGVEVGWEGRLGVGEKKEGKEESNKEGERVCLGLE